MTPYDPIGLSAAPAARPAAADLAAEVERLTRKLQREQTARRAAEMVVAKGLRDLSARQRAAELQRVVASAANQDMPWPEAQRLTLEKVCAHGGWSVGHVWDVLRDNGVYTLRSSRIWQLADAARAVPFVAATQTHQLGTGQGLAGRILRDGTPHWLEDIETVPEFGRRDAALACGLHSGCGFPVLVGPDVVAVLEFFAADPRPADEAQLQLLLQVGTQLGRVVERQRAGQHLLELNRRLDAALGHMSQGLCLFDADRRLLLSNRRFAEIYALSDHETRSGTPARTLAARQAALRDPDAADPTDRLLAQTALGEPAFATDELADGRCIAISHNPMPGGGWVATFEDITERREAEARIVHLAHHDALTNLPNRTRFRDRLRQALAHAARNGGHVAVICLDLDRFKLVNDTLGHPAGDALLVGVTARLQRCVREMDTVARLGGDEFAIIQTEAHQPSDASALAQRLVAEMALPFDLLGHQVVVGASIGIAVAPTDGDHPDTMLRHADLALDRAKADGRGTFRFFEPDMDARMQARLALEMDLRRALDAEEFELFYQPVVDFGTRRPAGFEALVRWRHPERGLVAPSEFIPLAEEIGLIVPLGDWVLRRACRDATGWPMPVKVAVNLSPAQFAGRGPVPMIAAALAETGLDPARLELEITETLMIADTEATLATLRAMKALGVSIALDDFGTGYSSLSYLRSFPFDRVKIDRSFISGLGQKEDNVAIVEAIVALCRSLGMKTTAEGVETEEQFSSLAASCSNAQGYLFSPPRPAGEVPALLALLMDGAQPA